jgi:tetratricopeptide (TPR) repeat protein
LTQKSYSNKILFLIGSTEQYYRINRRPKNASPRGCVTEGRLKWFRVVGLLGVPLALLLAAEGTLRLTGYGYSTCFFLSRKLDGRAVWTDNSDFGRRFFPPGLARRPQPFVLPSTKSTNTLRIFILGESAAMGDPDLKFGLPRMLEVLLRERFPERRIELVNQAMVAINSYVVLPIARDSVAKKADLWVVYMGNNEMVGPYGSASVFGARVPALPVVRAGLWLKQTRVGQVLDAGLHGLRRGGRSLPEWTGMELMAEQKVRYNSPETKRVYEHFQQNLSELLATAARAGVPVILCTVATNLRDCAPFASLHGSGPTEMELSEWQKAYDTGRGLEETGNILRAKESYEAAARIDAQFADLSFRLGECSRLLGKDAEAAAFFEKARDQDALQFRADSRINGLIRQAAQTFAGRGVSLVDVEQLLATNSPQGLTGSEFFYEHVHLRPEGNYLLAQAVAEASAQALALKAPKPWVSLSECLRLVGLTDWNRYDALNTIIDRMQRVPFTSQLNHERQMERLNEQFSRYRPATKPVQARAEAGQVAEQAARFPDDPDLRWNLAVLLQSSGDTTGAEAQWRVLRQLQPFSALPAFNLAKLLEGAGRQSEAIALYYEALRTDPGNSLVREQLKSVASSALK